MQEKIQKISPIKQRILQFANTLGISKRDFYTKTGISRGTLESSTGITEDTITKVFATFQELSPSWVITGLGEMLNFQSNNNENCNPNCNPNCNLNCNQSDIHEESRGTPIVKVKLLKEQLQMPPELLSNKTRISVPFYNLPVSAGALGVLETEVFAGNEPDGFVELSVFEGCEAVFPIIGVSMEPIISSGDWVGIKSIISLSRSWDFLQTDVIYLIITREERMIKFIERATDDDFIICKSPNASPFKVFKGDILKLYRIKACAKKL